jgi:hypothetical protein
MRLIKPSELDQYISDGYYIAKASIAKERVNTQLADMGLFLQQFLKRAGLPFVDDGDLIESLHKNLQLLHGQNQYDYIKVLKIFGSLQALYRIFFAPDILKICKELGVQLPFMHTQPIFHLLSNYLKIDDGYFGFCAHQDWSGLQTSLNSLVVWAPFHSIDSSRFPLEVVPGSHKLGLCPGKEQNNDYELDAVMARPRAGRKGGCPPYDGETGSWFGARPQASQDGGQPWNIMPESTCLWNSRASALSMRKGRL